MTSRLAENRKKLGVLVSKTVLEPHNARCRIRAQNDVEAMERWLEEYFDRPTTYRTYKKEAERFLVWCQTELNLRLEDLMREHVEMYINFLKNPSPKEKWCGPRRPRLSSDLKDWKPFTGPLSESAIKSALAVLNSLMSYLVDAGYVQFNAFSLVRKKSRFQRSLSEQAILVKERILSTEEWEAILLTMNASSEVETIEACARRRFLISILYFLGLRIDELEKATWHNFRFIDGKWWFLVKGKGGKLGKIPVNSFLLSEIMQYRLIFAMAPVPTVNEEGPLIFSLKGSKEGLSSRQMSKIIKSLAMKAALNFPKDSISFSKLMRFSPHWLRHLSASRQDLAGISFTNIKNNLRHENEQTTRQYVHSEDNSRHKEMEKLRMR